VISAERFSHSASTLASARHLAMSVYIASARFTSHCRALRKRRMSMRVSSPGHRRPRSAASSSS
jgi:hypothetical protein